MIVVLGRPGLAAQGADGSRPLGGLASLVALAAVARGARVELVGSIGEDASGDAVAVALGRAGVGHAALLRDPAGTTPVEGAPTGLPVPRMEAADVELGLRYLSDCRVLVVADGLGETEAAATMDAAGYHGAPVIAVVRRGAPVPAAWERGATVLMAPDPDAADPDDDDPAPFAGLVAGFAMALADGVPPREALGRAASGGGWERAPE